MASIVSVLHNLLVPGQVLESERAGACVQQYKDIAECKDKQEVQMVISEILNDKYSRHCCKDTTLIVHSFTYHKLMMSRRSDIQQLPMSVSKSVRYLSCQERGDPLRPWLAVFLSSFSFSLY